MKKTAFMVALAAAAAANAQLAISIGIRETGTTANIGENGGSANGIEWVNKDGQNLVLDGSWQTFTFNFQGDPLTAFAGATANGLYDGTRGVLEHIRIANTSGVTGPMTLWLDSIKWTSAAGAPTTFGDFEGFSDGTEVMFQEPSFSGSTSANLVAGSTAGVDNSVANTGSASYKMAFEFVDNAATRWVRMTTSNTAISPNPTIDWSQGSTLTFAMRSSAPVPEPATMTLLGLGAVAVLRRRKK